MNTSDKEHTNGKNLRPLLAWVIIFAVIGVMMTAVWPVWKPDSTIRH
ncbi:protein of unknown function [Nitrosotalea devaniterrae]|uniref:Uncharacterized protein n=1 Tax=Nitrosotalea devaniterrae TaxID=1078905 RepID=A0A128A3A9_9ARCH|nr:protein of unknown function [Candidatus Nitrosotalea devanaterra]